MMNALKLIAETIYAAICGAIIIASFVGICVILGA